MATNVITARFGGKLSTRTASKYQYDYGQVLKFADLDLPAAYEVHFSNREFFGVAIKQLGNADGVPIPDELFWSDTARAIYAWVYLHHTEDDGETVYKVTIPLAQRSRPSDVEPTPVQQDVIAQAIAALQSATEETAASAAEAVASAEQAAGSAAEAAESATEAQTARDAAVAAAESTEQYATRAETAAGQAEDAAGLAAATAEAVESRVSDAETAANRAETAATQAAGSATTASGAASQAAQKAGEASTYATNAAASASQAQTYASNAGDSATAAAGYAGAASGSATAAGQSADDAAASATAASQSETNADQSAAEAAASADAAAESAEDAEAAVQTIKTTTAAIIVDSASGAVVSVPDGADDLPMRSVKVMIEPVQDLHGYDKPWAAGAGKNILPITAVTSTVHGVTFTVDTDGIITTSGTATENIIFVISQAGAVTYKAGESYILNGCPTGGSSSSYWLSIAGVLSADYGNGGGVWTPQTDISTYNTRIDVRSGTNMDGKVFRPMVRLASETDATFAPYSNICPISGHDDVTVTANGTDYTTDLPVTVYGGTLDVVTGELTVDRFIKVFDGSESFVTNTAWGDYAKLCNIRIQALSSVSTPNAISSHFERSKSGGWAGLTANHFMIAGNTYIGLGWGGSVDELKTFLTEQYAAGTPVQVIGFLATPTTYHLTPQEVRTLLGSNVVMSDAGTVEITYPCDTKLYILKVVGA